MDSDKNRVLQGEIARVSENYSLEKADNFVDNFADTLAEIGELSQSSLLTEISFTKLASLGSTFFGLADAFRSKGLYRVEFPKGVKGELMKAKDGNGYLGAIKDENGKIISQARLIPEGVSGSAVASTALTGAVMLAVLKKIEKLEQGQKEILEILERDKKSQLLADYDLLVTYIQDYRFYWENEATVMVNLNQVKNIKRNVMKDIRSYKEQLENLISQEESLFFFGDSKDKINRVLDRFAHYNLGLNVFSLSQYLEVMLSQNYQAEYLEKISAQMREYAGEFAEVYSNCYARVENLKNNSLSIQGKNALAGSSRFVGNLIGAIPWVKEGPVDEKLVGFGDWVSECNQKEIEKTLSFFTRHQESGLLPVARHIDVINQISNQPVLMKCDSEGVSFCQLKELP